MITSESPRISHLVVQSAIYLLVVSSTIAVHAQQIYWSQIDGPTLVGRANLDGTGSITLPTPARPFGIEVLQSSSQVLWLNRDTLTIEASTLDLLGESTWLSGLPEGSGLNLAVDPTSDMLFWSYYIDDHSARIGRARLSSRAILDPIISPGKFSEDIALSPTSQRVYWSTQDGGIYSSNYDGTNQSLVKSLGTSLGSGATGIQIDTVTGQIYFSVSNAHKIYRMNADGTDLQTLATLPVAEYPFGMSLYQGRMYWADHTGGRLRSAQMDGGDITTILSGLSEPRQVFVVPEPVGGILLSTYILLAIQARRRNPNPSEHRAAPTSDPDDGFRLRPQPLHRSRQPGGAPGGAV